MDVRKFFKLLEYTFTGKRFPMEKLKRNETSCIKINSTSFEDPAHKETKEEIRLKDAKVSPHISELYY